MLVLYCNIFNRLFSLKMFKSRKLMKTERLVNYRQNWNANFYTDRNAAFVGNKHGFKEVMTWNK